MRQQKTLKQKGIQQECILLPLLFNLHTETICEETLNGETTGITSTSDKLIASDMSTVL